MCKEDLKYLLSTSYKFDKHVTDCKVGSMGKLGTFSKKKIAIFLLRKGMRRKKKMAHVREYPHDTAFFANNFFVFSDFRLQRHIFKRDCRKSKAILVGLRSCRREVWGIASKKEKKTTAKNKKKGKSKINREGLWLAYILRCNWRSFLKS